MNASPIEPEAKNFKSALSHDQAKMDAHAKGPQATSFVELDEEKSGKARLEKFRSWEDGINNMSVAIVRSIETFYKRKSFVYEGILSSALSNREAFFPQPGKSLPPPPCSRPRDERQARVSRHSALDI